MNSIYLTAYLALVLLTLVFDGVAETLNLKSFSKELPGEFKGICDETGYQKARDYQFATVRFGLTQKFFSTAVSLAFLIAGGFGWVDHFARGLGFGTVATGLVFAGVLSLLRTVLQLPFSVYDTFIIEERFGFNKTTWQTFVGDLIKGLLLGSLLGGLIFGFIIYAFDRIGPSAWLYAWLGFSFFQILLTFLAPVVLMPLFNKFDPLAPGELQQAIQKYASTEKFELSGVFTMDGSKRSSKANAFFTGFGKFRRLVLFDTLIGKQTVEELVAVVAHEVGHFKCGHIPKSIALSFATTAAVFWGASHFLTHPEVSAAFGVAEPSVYVSLIFAGMVFSPLFRWMSLFPNLLSRHFEYEADRFSARTFGKPEALISALKKLSAENLSHLTPHPLKVLMDYSHPPTLRRIEALRRREVVSK